MRSNLLIFGDIKERTILFIASCLTARESNRDAELTVVLGRGWMSLVDVGDIAESTAPQGRVTEYGGIRSCERLE